MSKPNDKIPTTTDATPVNQEEECEITNMEKYENIKTQFDRLKLAMDNAFYLEAIAIEYAIMEDRTRSILRYEGNVAVKKNIKPRTPISEKLNIIAKLAQQDASIGEIFPNDFINELRVWTRERNAYIHALIRIITTTNGFKNFAKRGDCLCKKLRDKANQYRRLSEKRKSQSQEG